MVRRRSTVRFRNGAPGHGQFFERIERTAWNESGRRSSAPIAANAPIAQPEPGGSYRRQPPSGGHAGAGRPSAGRPQASMSRIKIHGPPGGCRCRPARQAGVTTAVITAANLGRAGDTRGQDASPPVHAVRARNVLQLDGRRPLLGALRTCRCECPLTLSGRCPFL